MKKKQPFVLVTFLSPYVLHLSSSLDLHALRLISTCTWFQEAALESNQVSVKGKKQYQVPRFLGNKYEQYTLLIFSLICVFLKYENLCVVSFGIYKSNHTASFMLYTTMYFDCQFTFYWGFPGGAYGKEPACWCRRHKRCGFHLWVGKIPWRKKGLPTPVFSPGKFLGQRSPAGYSPWGCREVDTIAHTSRYILLQEFHWPNAIWYLPHSDCILMN